MIITDDCRASLSFIFVFTIINWLLISLYEYGRCVFPEPRNSSLRSVAVATAPESRVCSETFKRCCCFFFVSLGFPFSSIRLHHFVCSFVNRLWLSIRGNTNKNCFSVNASQCIDFSSNFSLCHIKMTLLSFAQKKSEQKRRRQSWCIFDIWTINEMQATKWKRRALVGEDWSDPSKG